MAKVSKEMWIILMVAAVAVVGLLLTMTNISWDVTGQAVKGASKATIKRCTETDSGKDITTKGVLSYAGSKYTDACSTSSKVTEYYCKGDAVTLEAISCGAATSWCDDGTCLECSDTDGDKGFPSAMDTKGTVSGIWGSVGGNVQSYTDTCADETRIQEGYCTTDGYAYYSRTDCYVGSVCYDGVCTSKSDLEVMNIVRLEVDRTVTADTLTLTFQVINNGYTDAVVNDFAIDLNFDEDSTISWNVGMDFIDTRTITSPGMSEISVTLPIGKTSWTDGLITGIEEDVRVSIYLDKDKETDEYNEDNNAYETTITVSSGDVLILGTS